MSARSIPLYLHLLLSPLLCWSSNWSDRWSDEHHSPAKEQRLKNTYIHPNWAEHQGFFHFCLDSGEGPINYVINLKTGRRSELISDYSAFAKTYENLTGLSLKRQDIKLYRLDFPDGSADSFVANIRGKHIKYNNRTGEMDLVPHTRTSELQSEDPSDRQMSADSLYTIIPIGADLALRDNTSGETTRITFDGESYFSYTQESRSEHKPRGGWVGHKYIALLREEGEIHKVGLIRSLTKARPKVITFNMPIPGDESVPQYAIYYFDADKRRGGILDIDKYKDQELTISPYRSAEDIYFTRINRKGDKIDLCRIDLKTGKVREVISENCPPHYNRTLFNYRIINGGKHILWWSERTGYGHYYLYDRSGKFVRQVTQGDKLVCGRIRWIDERKGTILFEGYGGQAGQHPQYAHHYIASIHGRQQYCINPQNGHHELELSPERGYVLDKCSRMDMPPAFTIIDLKHRQKSMPIHSVSTDEAKLAGWVAPTLFSLKAGDNKTDLYGIMYLPSDLDPQKKYPIISYVYPGPQTDMMPLGFEMDENNNQSLADAGFVVVQIPSRGSCPVRGRAFYTYGYGNLRDYPLRDNKKAIEALARQHPFVDLSRVGIYGHSGGGFHTVTSMLTYPNFYKVGVAASGNYDNNIYIRWWAETFHGVHEEWDPKTGKTKFVIQVPTPIELVNNLKGHLLLMTGDEDRNVPPSSTYRLADALIRAGKHFDMFVFPGKDHQLESPYYFEKIKLYFVEHLLHKSPTISINKHS